MSGLRVFLTGRVAAEANGRVVDERRLPGRQGRLLFVYLVAARSRPVPRDELADAIWGESPPATWEKALAVIVSKLRGLLADDEVVLTHAFGCYRLDLPDGAWVDINAAAEAADQAERALEAGEVEEGRAAAELAASLLERPFLPGEDGVWVVQKRRELAEIHVRAVSALAESCLSSGDPAEAAKWAEKAVALAPFRERGYRLLMEAHVAAGDRAEALRVYERCRRLLADELGTYPSPETESMYRALLAAPEPSARATPPVVEPSVEPGEPVLAHDQTELPMVRAKATERSSRKRRAVLVSALSGAIAAAVVIPLVAFDHGARGGRAAVSATGDALAVVDARSDHLVATTGVGATPTAVATGEGAYWVTNADGQTVSRIDPGTNAVVDTIPVGDGPSGIATGAGAVWVVNSLDGTVSRIDPDTNTVVQTIDVGGGPRGIVYAAGSVWVANTGDGTIVRIVPESGRPTKPLQVAATELAFGAGTLWASQRAAGQVVRIDPATGKQVSAPIHVGNGPTGITFGHGAAWVANSLDGTVSRIDPDTNSVIATVLTGNGPDAVAVDPRGVWVSNQFEGDVVRIDPGRNQVAQRVSVGSRVSGLAMSGSAVLVAVPHSGAGHRGGTLVLRTDGPTSKGGTDSIDSIDYALSMYTYVSPLLRMTGDGLVAFNQVSGLAGTQLVPDLATSLPAPTDGGRTYTFHVRPGIHYSNGRPVQPTDFRSTLERFYALGAPVPDYDGIVGGAQCRKHPRRCDLSRGIVADDRAHTVTFNLSRPDPDFLNKLASAFAYVLPGGTPRRPAGTHPLPATGPYMIKTYEPGRLLRFVRNPFFHEWSRAAQPDGYPDRIDIRIAGTPDEAIRDVVDGNADVVRLAEPWTPSQLSRLELQHRSQLHSDPRWNLQALFLNPSVPPFNRLDARRAINLAVDRAAATNAWGGRNVAEPTCQLLPPNFPSYHRYCPYTAGSTKIGKWTAPDLAKARALVARSGTRGMKVTVWAWSQAKGFNQVAVKALRSLGYRVAVKPVVGDKYWGVVGDSRNRAQIGFTGWAFGYPDPGAFLVPSFSCAAFLPGDPLNLNSGGFCDQGIDRQMEKAQAEQLSDPIGSRARWQRVDRELTDAAPWVPLVVTKDVNFLSKRVGNYQYSPQNGMLIDQLWVR
jgi:peptide/nickel transport system substrate-binding protein